MSRNVTAAPTNEIAIGRKMSDLATASPRRSRSASVAKASPTLTATSGTSDDPARGVAQRPQHALVGEHELVVVEAHEALRTGRPEAEQERVDHGVDEEHAEDHERRPDEHVGPDALAAARRAAGRRAGPWPRRATKTPTTPTSDGDARPPSRRLASSSLHEGEGGRHEDRQAAMITGHRPRPRRRSSRSGSPARCRRHRGLRSRIASRWGEGAAVGAAAPSRRHGLTGQLRASWPRCRRAPPGGESGPPFMYSTMPVQKLPLPDLGRHEVGGVEAARALRERLGQDHRGVGEDARWRSSPARRSTFGRDARRGRDAAHLALHVLGDEPLEEVDDLGTVGVLADDGELTGVERCPPGRWAAAGTSRSPRRPPRPPGRRS